MPSPAAALRVKISPIRMYLASISADLWPVWRMMSRSLTPFIAAWVTQAMSTQRLWLQAGAAGGPLHDPADAVPVKPAAGELAVAVDPAKDGAGADARRGQPAAQRADRAGGVLLPKWNTDLAAGSLLVGLRAAEVDDQAVLGEGEVGEVNRSQFRTAEGAGEADENERPVTEA